MQLSKMSELDLVLQEFHAAAKVLISAADSLRDFYSQPAESDSSDAPAKAKSAPAVTMEDVRRVLSAKSRNGLTAEVKALLRKYGQEKLSDIDPGDYAALLADAEVLSSG